MYAYSFYHDGEHFCTIWGARYAADHIESTARMARRGIRKEFLKSPATGKDCLAFADGFKLFLLRQVDLSGKWSKEEITPDNVSSANKAVRQQLKSFVYVGGAWCACGGFDK